MRFLIVDDDGRSANRLRAVLTSAGHDVVGIAATAAEGIELLNRFGCGGAIIEAHLSGSCSEPIAKALRRRGIPFVVVSSYSPDRLLTSLRDVPFEPKPVNPIHLLEAVASLEPSTSEVA
jgi:DNA-binding response OmpR family regulator